MLMVCILCGLIILDSFKKRVHFMPFIIFVVLNDDHIDILIKNISKPFCFGFSIPDFDRCLNCIKS